MKYLGLKYTKNYAEFKKNYLLVSLHPSFVFEDNENYYIIHLSTFKNSKQLSFEPLRLKNNDVIFRAKNVLLGGNYSPECDMLLCKHAAIVNKAHQIKIGNKYSSKNKILKITFDYTCDNKNELESLLKECIDDLEFYNGDYKRDEKQYIATNSFIKKSVMIDCLKQN